MVEVKVRVLNKTKEGVKFKYLDMGIEDEATWEEFNDTFVATDKKFIYRVSDKNVNIMEEKSEFFTKLMPHVLMTRAKGIDMTSAFAIGDTQKKYQEKFGGSPMDFINDYKMFEKVMLEGMMNEGIGVGKVHREVHDLPDPVKKESTGCSIGDMLKAKSL